MNKIGELIKQARLESGLSAEQIIDSLGFKNRTSIYQLEKREKIDFSLLKKIAKLYNKPLSFFVDYNAESKNRDIAEEENETDLIKNENKLKDEIYTKDQKIISLQETIIELQKEIIKLQK